MKCPKAVLPKVYSHLGLISTIEPRFELLTCQFCICHLSFEHIVTLYSNTLALLFAVISRTPCLPASPYLAHMTAVADHLLIGFLSPMVNPKLEPFATQGGPTLPTCGSNEFTPFIKRLPEFLQVQVLCHLTSCQTTPPHIYSRLWPTRTPPLEDMLAPAVGSSEAWHVWWWVFQRLIRLFCFF